ncbi:MAG TPA: hypothetical protein PLD54_00450 [Candidatus Levybacteria bacterium]|nr:hypothetical protein [Candidatus Levybacteria bacterium]
MDIQTKKLFFYAGVTAFVAGSMMTVMIVLMHIFPYANMLKYEQVRSVTQYSADLLQAGMPIRIVATIDHMFLIFVLATFLLVGQALKNEKNSLIITLAMIPALLTAGLDIGENHHVISMMTAVLQNIPISQNEINTQAILSLTKFHAGNITFFLLAFFLPHKSIAEKILRFTLLFVLIPVSVIRYSFQDLMPESVISYIPIALGFLLASYVFIERSKMKTS